MFIGGKKELQFLEEKYRSKGGQLVVLYGSSSSIMQNLWDSVLKGQNVMLILCGSAMSFMEKEILAEKNPLYGRASRLAHDVD